MVKQFLRRDSARLKKLGKNRRKKQKWRNPTGRDNKMREKRRGYAPTVSIGYGTDKKEKGKFDGKKIVRIMNMKEFEKLLKNEIALLGNIGMKLKMEIAKKAKEKNVAIYNLNVKKFLKKNEKIENGHKAHSANSETSVRKENKK